MGRNHVISAPQAASRKPQAARHFCAPERYNSQPPIAYNPIGVSTLFQPVGRIPMNISRPIHLFVVLICLSLIPRVHAGLIVDQQPIIGFGTISDTEYLDQFGVLLWQRAADDISINIDCTIRHITWWGFYGGISGQSIVPPLGDELIRIRIYSARSGDGLPGKV
jgi:hypothetical protein